jgi:sialate O-acetylesterase
MSYRDKMEALITGWRTVWDDARMPFYFVQLAPYRYNTPDWLPDIWEAQLAALAIPHTGMAVTTDIENVTDIHPKNKQEVGRRLALWALAKTYEVDLLSYSGPIYKSMKNEGDRIRLFFEHADDGLVSLDGKPLSWFTIAGADQSFVEAEALIDGNMVVVQSDTVPEPLAVRFGWHEEGEPNLANKTGLPASPFRTHSW